MKVSNLRRVAASLLTASVVLTAASISLVDFRASAQQYEDPDYGIEIANNTVCSFITGNNVNVRNGSGTQYKVVTQLNRGDTVRATHREGNWVAIAARVYGTAPNETFVPLNGWVSNDYINGCSEDQFDTWRN